MCEFGVLGPVTAWDAEGRALDLKGPRHRAVLARLLVAHGRVVSVDRIADDLWEDPPAGAIGAVRTFVAALRRALEPDRPPRGPARVLVTEGPGYALRADAVDAWRFERAVSESPTAALQRSLFLLDEALAWWRGSAYADVGDRPWVLAERRRLDELRLAAVERRAEALFALGRAAEAVPDLDAHAREHPWREEAWRLLALGLYRSGRQVEALAVVRRASGLLRDELGLEPGRRLRDLETELLRHGDGPGGADALWEQASAAFAQVRSIGAGPRIESTVSLLRGLALTGAGGLEAAGEQRVAAIEAAERLDDPMLTARVIGAYDVPAVWTRADDPARAARVAAAADRTLTALGPNASPVLRARLLATIAVESRGTGGPRESAAAREAERIARDLRDPALLAFALNGLFMQSCHRAGLAPEREMIGAELVDLAGRYDLSSFGILGHLIRLQARAARAAFTAADEDATAAEALADRHERPLVKVFTSWYRAMRTAATADFDTAASAYREAALGLRGSGMPGVESGLEALALLCLRVQHNEPIIDHGEWGPYEPWARPLLLAAQGHHAAAATALRNTPEPPRDLLLEALWTLTARAAIDLGDLPRLLRAREALAPAANELAGAGSGMLTAGPVARHLADLDAAIAAHR
jgi:DNA-binding SARP family transcriptional activator